MRDLVAAFVGFEAPAEPGDQAYMTAGDLKRLMAMTGGKIEGMA